MRKLSFMKFIKSVSFLSLLFILSCVNDSVLPKSQNQLIANGFYPIWQLFLSSSNNGWENNENGRLSNDTAAALEGLLLLFESTSDITYIKHFFELSDKIMANNDLERGIRDSYRGNKILPGWSSTRYTNDGSSHIFEVSDALIHIPFVKCYRILQKKTDDIPNQYVEKATKLFLFSQNAFSEVFLKDWYQIDSSTGYFHDPYFKFIGINTPLNQTCVFSIFVTELYNATQDDKYFNYIIGTANYFKQNSIITNTSHITWNYNSGTNTRIEDTAHGSWIYWFVITLFENGIYFDKSDINILSKTFLDNIHKGNNQFSFFINGDGKIKKDPIILHYFLLSPYNDEIKELMQTYWEEREINFDSNIEFNHLGYFLVFYYGLINKYN